MNGPSIFDTHAQGNDVNAKILVALERITEVFRVALWNVGKTNGLSPLQIQLLIFLKFHRAELRKVSYLAQEFNLSKPTISEAVRTLLKKGLIEKETLPEDTRSFLIHLSDKGEQLVHEISFFANDLKQGFSNWSEKKKRDFYQQLLQLINNLQQLGWISIQRTCYSCRFFQNDQQGPYCKFLKMPLQTEQLQVDCPDFESKNG